MRFHLKTLTLFAALMLALLLTAPVAFAQPKHMPPGQAKKMMPGQKAPGPPPHAPAHGYRHKYRFYPEQKLYYDIDDGWYYHYEGGQWRRFDNNPLLNIQLGPFFTIDMDTDLPYTHYQEHRTRYKVSP
ncbi:hypothetical protein [Oceanidesulfovibrio marinus]|uniref:Regulator RcnB of Ni and Co efflux n=1 Tax=Oceanidesulfovibrio marinus TaxID=370038 RepID=A0A6P1ZDY0_9BACT|nr:hypothetical protein [Oceanidesulfovibrio marinus]QJT09259.1 hypothetical protein E8L03_10050 [Oceanidesulfovibrio marinus]TVM32754.1 hypothetical protein DQK91_13665 [Oceanidesulfovibrio marinus]